MSFLLDKDSETGTNHCAVLGTLPRNSEGDVILHFFSTFDDYDTQVTVTGVTQQGNWLLFEVTDENVPNRSGRYKVEFHTTSIGSVALKDLHQPFDELESPLRDLDAFQKDIQFAESVGEIKNATNALFEAQGRTMTFKEQQRPTTVFKSQARDYEYKTQF